MGATFSSNGSALDFEPLSAQRTTSGHDAVLTTSHIVGVLERRENTADVFLKFAAEIVVAPSETVFQVSAPFSKLRRNDSRHAHRSRWVRLQSIRSIQSLPPTNPAYWIPRIFHRTYHLIHPRSITRRQRDESLQFFVVELERILLNLRVETHQLPFNYVTGKGDSH